MSATVDPFGNVDSVNNGSNNVYASSSSAVTGGLWTSRTIATSTLSTANATSNFSVSGGSAVLTVTQVGASVTAGTNQKAKITYSSTGSGPDFTGFSSLQFDYASTLGTIGVRVFIAGMTGSYVQKSIAGGSGTLTINASEFAINPAQLGGVPTLWLEFFRNNGSNASGTFSISNLVANGVPAPGAVALLAAAGLVGARRRR